MAHSRQAEFSAKIAVSQSSLQNCAARLCRLAFEREQACANAVIHSSTFPSCTPELLKLGVLRLRRFFKRTPGPPPFSLTKFTPDDCKAVRIASSAASETLLRDFSKSTTVESPRLASFASMPWDIFNRARPALIWSGVTKINNFC